jgi:hypothetical protein
VPVCPRARMFWNVLARGHTGPERDGALPNPQIMKNPGMSWRASARHSRMVRPEACRTKSFGMI